MYLGGLLGPRAQIKETARKGCSSLEVLQLEKYILCSVESEHKVHGLKVAMGKIGRQLSQSDLLCFWRFLAVHLSDVAPL